MIAELRQTAKWAVISMCVGLLAGCASAVFLKSLDHVTAWRESHLWIVWFLPVCGFIMSWLYEKIGKGSDKGHDLLMDEIHDPKAVVPLRMAPLILLATITTHLFGGSAGREGTAVQMSGSLADQLTGLFRLSSSDRRILLMAGISAGFGSVFGTPLAGAIFGLEVLAIGRVRYEAIFPCFLASIAGHQVTQLWGIQHSLYSIGLVPSFSWQVLLMVSIAGIAFGLTGRLFAKLIHGTQSFFKKFFLWAPLRPFVGGILVVAGVWIVGSTQYIGLGLAGIDRSLTGTVGPFDWLMKIIFTVLTLGTGFKGGEVTPLFYIGSTLGNTLSGFLHMPASFLAGLGMVAVFAGAANTPITCMILAIELFGAPIGVYAAIACVMSFLFSGHTGIYVSQKRDHSKHTSQQADRL